MSKNLYEIKSLKFYGKSLTLLLSILQGVKEGLVLAEIARQQHRSKSCVSYHSRRLIEIGYMKEVGRDVFKILVVTQPGSNFVDRYGTEFHVRLENIRFKARILKMPSRPLNWKAISMRNWVQYISEVDEVKVHLNKGKMPTIEFIPSPTDGDDPYKLRDSALKSCINAARHLESTIGIKVDSIECSSKPEYVVYSPLAKELTTHIGQVRVNGIGKLNSSKPLRKGEFEYVDPRDAAIFLALPREVLELKNRMDRVDTVLREGRKEQD